MKIDLTVHWKKSNKILLYVIMNLTDDAVAPSPYCGFQCG